MANERPMLMPEQSELAPHTDPLVGQTLGEKYTLARLLGRGGMGHVYLAEVTGSDTADMPREVVVKMVAPSLDRQAQVLARFEREAKRLGELHHSNIVEMYDHGRDGGRAYIVMEWVDGELLSDAIARKGRLRLAEFVPIAAQILKGFGYAHARDLMIRDIKPANVMLCERKGRANFVKIIDFGLAKRLDDEENITKQHLVGTSGYLSPEQIQGLDLDLRVDVYAIGVLFYQMLSGRMPFEADNDTTLLYKHIHDAPTPLTDVLPDEHEVPDELVRLVHDCLAKDPRDRPNDANEIVERLIDCVPMSMFKLPAARPMAADQASVSALSTAALAAPPGETAAYLRRERGKTAPGNEEDPSAMPTVAARPGTPSRGKRGMLVGGIAGVAVLCAYVLFGRSPSESPVERPTTPTVSDSPSHPSSIASGQDASTPTIPAEGTLEIDSNPPAALSIDGSPAGTTPHAQALPIGKHRLEITLEGHAPWTREIEIERGINRTFSVELMPLEVESEEAPPEPGPDPESEEPRPADTRKSKSKSKKPEPEEPEPEKTEPERPEPKQPEPETSKASEAEPKKVPFLPTTKNKAGGPFLPTEK